ncbi:phage terminase large subunit [Bradyrhizobium sp. JYMT SZCCT0180]|uniref:phage terminase large subunit n=1 Tax=Bradyrhizobium sp. JYMT SZCCT0180 TaxID=2807666 RepID=UPI001BA86358|nr:phage terminase large subunit [Bradyrhizobium sp. JYMT SZCCT0180]MBR1211098.1 phage terminase large subunit [Bradyrhizobium sp. JYMT SZCCT0180]
MKRKDQDFLNAAMRTNFMVFLHRCFLTLNPGAEFKPNWHLEAIAHRLNRVLRGEVTRLIINMPPRSLKSMSVTVAFMAFLLGHFPHRKTFAISYGEELAAEHAAQFRAIVESQWYRQLFPGMRVARAANSDIYTTKRGFRKATSIGATLTGLGGDTFVIDDPLKPTDALSDLQRNKANEWFPSTLMSRLDDKRTGVIIVVMQRVHMQDLTGYLLDNFNDWDVLKLPAIADSDEHVPIGVDRFHVRKAGEALHPEREPLEFLEQFRHRIGLDVFAAQYQQTPVPPGGSMIQTPWLRYYDSLPDIPGRPDIIQSWDTASKTGIMNSYSVCTTWLRLGPQHYLVDMVRSRFEFPELRKQAIELANKYNPKRILVEDTSTGTSLVQELQAFGINSARAIKPRGDKVERLYVQQDKFAQGLVLLPRAAPYLPELRTELLSFPQAKTDDIVDSITQALAYQFDDNEYDSTMSWVGDTDVPYRRWLAQL